MKRKIAPPHLGLETTTHRSRAECSDCWSTGMWHFSIHGFGKANRARATAPISIVNSLSWNNRNFVKWKISPLRSGPESTTPQLHAEWSNCWATGIWHFPIYGLGYRLWWYKYFVCKYDVLSINTVFQPCAATTPTRQHVLFGLAWRAYFNYVRRNIVNETYTFLVLPRFMTKSLMKIQFNWQIRVTMC